MMATMFPFLAAILVLSPVGILTGEPQGNAARINSALRTVDVTARRFEFSPNQITLDKGETVKLRLTSDDVVHGFFHRALKLDELIEPGKVTEVTLTPDVAGTFTVICHHFCGIHHTAMKMTVVVNE